MADGFLSRWSQRKQDVRQGKEVASDPVEEPRPEALAKAVSDDAGRSSPQVVAKPAVGTLPTEEPQAKLPTLEDVSSLTPDSDFSSFVAQGVSPQVRNAAVKKLFADPRYSLIDGLDIYLEDYSLPSPLSAAVLAKMNSAKVLRLVEDPDEPKAASADQTHETLAHDHAATEPSPDEGSDPVTARTAAPQQQDPAPITPPQHSGQPTGESHDDPDLRLQSNHAAVGDDAERGT